MGVTLKGEGKKGRTLQGAGSTLPGAPKLGLGLLACGYSLSINMNTCRTDPLTRQQPVSCPAWDYLEGT